MYKANHKKSIRVQNDGTVIKPNPKGKGPNITIKPKPIKKA